MKIKRSTTTERRLKAVEAHVQDLEKRLSAIMYMHLTEFHPGQDAVIPRNEDGSIANPHDTTLFSEDQVRYPND